MKKKVNIVIDALINSIRNIVSGEVFDTVVIKVAESDFKFLKKGWAFNWIQESKDYSVYKLTTRENPEIIQGLVSIRKNVDHIFINLIENASFNIGKNRVYEGVAGNLFAFACKFSMDSGYLGNVSFVAKTNLISHYEETIGARRFGTSNIMAIDYFAAQQLIQKYFKENL
ncbi:MAG: hypothetical protein IAE93_13220 [Ignavibacteria bacterium]|nr:hypothetical protein [Ignavibacteria bacterium]